MKISRTAIYDTLYQRLSGTPGIVTLERRLRAFDEVSPSEMPYLCLTAGNQVVQRNQGLPSTVTLRCELYLYVHDSGSDGPWRRLNEMLDVITECLKPKEGEAVTQNRFRNVDTTLDGLVSSCTIDGVIETDEGTLGDTAVAIIPVALVTHS